jgi:hypothetical protein
MQMGSSMKLCVHICHITEIQVFIDVNSKVNLISYVTDHIYS